MTSQSGNLPVASPRRKNSMVIETSKVVLRGGNGYMVIKGRALTMRLLSRMVASIELVFCVAAFVHGAEVTGTVKGPDGAPFAGAFVQARNSKTKITVSVLSRRGGEYRIPNLPAGEYEVRIRAVGYQAQPHTGVTLTADQTASFEFALQNGKVHWTDLSLYQADQLLPAGKGKGALFTPQPGQPTATCAACHGIQTRIASTVRDEAGWRDRVEYMRTTMRVKDKRSGSCRYRFVSE